MIPNDILSTVHPKARDLYLRWASFMNENVTFSLADSLVHTQGHCGRVLLYAMMMAVEMGLSDEDTEALAHASIFHDTRRLDDYLDTGHGARAAVNYTRFCARHDDISFNPLAVPLMQLHDIDDRVGHRVIEHRWGAEAERVKRLYAVFKDADALDRFRLGRYGLDPAYLRTPSSRQLVDFARTTVQATLDRDFLAEMEFLVDQAIKKSHK